LGLVAEMMQAAGDIGTQWILDLCNRLHPRGLEVRCGITSLQGKEDPMKCGSYRGIKLSEHAMKMVERIFQHRIWQEIDIDDIQFGFMKGKGMSDTIYIVRQMQEAFTTKRKQFYFVFVDLEKAFDRVAAHHYGLVLSQNRDSNKIY